DLVTQRLRRARTEIPLEVEHVDAAALAALRLLLLLAVLRARLQELLEALLAVHRPPEHVRVLLELAIEMLHLEPVGLHAAAADADEEERRDQQEAQDRDQLRDEERVIGSELGHYSPTLLSSNTRSAR